MNRFQGFLFIGLLACLCFFYACQKELSCESCPNTPNNSSPIARSGPDQIIMLPADSVLLDGSLSTDPDGTITSYSWQQISGPRSSVLVSPSLSKTVSRLLTTGNYSFELTVTDNDNLSDKDTVLIFVGLPNSNIAPLSLAGSDQFISLPTDSVLLNGDASVDVDGIIISYQWRQVSGPSSAMVTNANLSRTIAKPLVTGSYLFELTVTDNGNQSDKDTIEVIVQPPNSNFSPVANAGSDQIVMLPTDSVVLNGMASIDPDGTIVSYRWRQITGPTISLAGIATQAQTVARGLGLGLYVYELTVTDNGNLSDADSIQVLVQTTIPNASPPVACAGPNQTISLPLNSVLLDGRCSSDPDNNITTYQWRKVSGPTSFSIATPNESMTQVNNLVAGFYHFELKVTDATGLISTDIVQVTVEALIFDCNLTNLPTIQPQLVLVGQLSQPRTHMAVASAGNKLLYAGGLVGNAETSRVDIYDIGSNSWSTASLSQARYWIGSVTVGSKIYFAGGIVDGEPVTTIDVYDASTNNWSVLNLSLAGHSIAAAGVGNKIIFAGGNGNGNGRERRVDIYNLSSNTWSIATLSTIYTEGHSAIAMGNKVYVAGGGTPTDVTSHIDIYDDNSNTWTTSLMLEAKTFFGTAGVGNKIYWGGGWVGVWTTCTLEVRDVITGTSTNMAMGLEVMYDHTIGQNTVVQNGKIIYFFQHYFNMYDTQSNTWSTGSFPPQYFYTTYIAVNNIVYTSQAAPGGPIERIYRIVF